MNEELVNPAERTLEGWKEIATFLKRDVRTVMRWEKGEGLPIRRHLHNQRSSVYALPSELNAWLAARAPQPVVPQAVAWWRPKPAIGMAFAIFLLMVSYKGGPLVKAQAQSRPTPTLTEVLVGAGADAGGSLSPDGRLFAGADWTSGDLAVWEVSSGKKSPLTDAHWKNYPIDPIWSPDGKQIAYGWCPTGTAPPVCELRTIGVSGGSPEVLFASKTESFEDATDWSRDGTFLVGNLRHANGNVSLVKLSLADHRMAEIRSLGISAEAKLSPDGRFVAYLAAEGGKQRAFLLSFADNRASRIDAFDSDEQRLSWSPDGRFLLFTSDRSGRWDLWAVAIHDGKPNSEPHVVYPDVGQIEMFHGWQDAGTFAFSKHTSSGQFYSISLDRGTEGMGEPQVAVPALPGQHMWAYWSKDSHEVVFAASTKPTGNLYLYNPASPQLRQFVTEPLQWFFFAGWPAGNETPVVVSRGADGMTGLYRLSVHAPPQLIFSDPDFMFPSGHISNDGSRILYVSKSGTGKTHRLHLYDLKHKKALQDFDSPDVRGRMAPDFRSYFYISAEKGSPTRLIQMSLASGERHPVAQFAELPAGVVRELAVSPDNRHVAFTLEPGTTGPRGSEAKRKLYIANAGGGTPQEVQTPASHKPRRLTWSRDGKKLGYISDDSRDQFYTLSNFLPQ